MAMEGAEKTGISLVSEQTLFAIVERAILPLTTRIASLEDEFRSLRSCIEREPSSPARATVAGSAAAPSVASGAAPNGQCTGATEARAQAALAALSSSPRSARPGQLQQQLEQQRRQQQGVADDKPEGTAEKSQADQSSEVRSHENGGEASKEPQGESQLQLPVDRRAHADASATDPSKDHRFIGETSSATVSPQQDEADMVVHSPRDDSANFSPCEGDTTAPPSLLGTQVTLLPSFTPPSRSPRTSFGMAGKVVHSAGSSHQSRAGPAIGCASKNVAESRSAVGTLVSGANGARLPDDSSARNCAVAAGQMPIMRFPLTSESQPLAQYRAANSPPLHSRPSPPAHSRPLGWSSPVSMASRGLRMTPGRQASPRQDQQSPFRQGFVQHPVQWPPQATLQAAPHSELRHANSQPALPQQMPSWHWVSSQQQAGAALSRTTPQPQRMVH
eukprot:TRINITY_DN48494_c0_g1_i1.p1 TRINITY_DN48494_c0_g1~~TRINITY_DN48494_c0_g1_i1.p1  ORF type:complete len:475 (+),score=59.61 TRINITY_DN48494_c0_g1_i1:86-1426(+)